MARSLKIRGEEAEITVELGAGPTAEALWEIFPPESRASLWGEEIYFPIPLSVEGEPDAWEEVEVGTVAYWPPGDALCLFFGPTPASVGLRKHKSS